MRSEHALLQYQLPIQVRQVTDNLHRSLRPGVDLIKLFGVHLLTLLCKLDHFINISNNISFGMKRSSLQNRVSKFTPKKFYEIDSCKGGT